MPAKYKDQAPKLVRDEKASSSGIFEDREVGVMGINATVSWPKEEWGFNPSALAEMRPGCLRHPRADP